MAGIMQELESVRAVFEEHRTATDACPFCLSARREHGTSWSFVKENHCRPAGHKWLPKYLLSALQEQSAPPTKDPDEDNPLTLPETAIRQDLIEHRKLTEETIAKFQGDIVDMQQKLDVATEAWREDYLAVRLAVKERYELLKAKIIEEHRKRKVELEDNQQRLEKQLQKTKQVYGDLFSKRTAVWKTKSQSPEREEEIERRGLECINGCPTVFQLGMRFEYADTNKSLAMEDIKQFGELKSDAIPDKEIIVEYAPICTLLKVVGKEERGSEPHQKAQQSHDTKAAMDDEKMDDSVPIEFDVDAIGKKDPDEDNPLTLRETAIRHVLIAHRKLAQETIAKFDGNTLDLQQKKEVATEAWRMDYLAVSKLLRERYELLKAEIIEEHRKRKEELKDNQQRLDTHLQKTKQVYGDLFSKRTAVSKTKAVSSEREEEIEGRGMECIKGCPTALQLATRFEYADTNKLLVMEDIKQMGELKTVRDSTDECKSAYSY